LSFANTPAGPSRASRLLSALRGHRRWWVVALLFAIALHNNLVRQNLSFLGPTLQAQFGFGEKEYSYMVAGFLGAYTVGYLFCGRLLDRWGVRIGLAAALAAWSLVGIAHAFCAGWISLLACRLVLGFAQSFNSPASVKGVAEWIPAGERGLSMAIASNGNIIGGVLAAPIVAAVTLRWGWRWGFVLTGVSGLVLLAAWWREYDSPEKHPRITPQERDYLTASLGRPGPVPAPAALTELLRRPVCTGLFIARFLTDSITFFFAFWLPSYLVSARGFSLAMIGLIGWIPFLAADVGGPGGGALSDWLVRRGWSAARARLTLMAIAACVMPAALVAVRTEAAGLALGLIALVLAAQSCWMANQSSFISECVERENVATLLSVSALGGSAGGMASTLLAGRVISQWGYGPVFTVLGFLHLIAFAVLAWCIRAGASARPASAV